MDDTDFGRLVYERRSGTAMIVTILVVAGLVVAGAIATGEPIAVAASVVIALGLGVAVWASAVDSLRCYEHGLTKKTLAGSRRLAYADVEVLEYSATRALGVGVRTNVGMTLIPAKPHGKVAFFGGSEEGVEAFRDCVAAAVARKIHDQLAAEGEVDWTGPDLRMSRSGLVFKKKKFVGSETVVIPHTDNPAVEFDRGVCTVRGRQEDVRIPMKARNFYPGFLVFSSLVEGAREAARA